MSIMLCSVVPKLILYTVSVDEILKTKNSIKAIELNVFLWYCFMVPYQVELSFESVNEF